MSRFWLVLLPPEVLEQIVLRLDDPEDVVRLLDSSGTIRDKLSPEPEKGRRTVFWRRFAERLGVPKHSALMGPVSRHDGWMTSADKMVALRRNVAAGRCKVSRFDFGCFFEEGLPGERYEANGQYSFELSWDGKRAFAVPNHDDDKFNLLPCVLWDTAESQDLTTLDPKDFVGMRCNNAVYCLWRDYLVYIDLTWDSYDEQQILTIFNLSERTRRPVIVKKEGRLLPDVPKIEFDPQGSSTLRLLEAADGTAKAIVVHDLEPTICYIILLPGGRLERKIYLPEQSVFGLHARRRRPASPLTSTLLRGVRASPDAPWEPLVFQDFAPSWIFTLCVTAINAESTVATLVDEFGLLNPGHEGAACTVTSRGDLIVVVLEDRMSCESRCFYCGQRSCWKRDIALYVHRQTHHVVEGDIVLGLDGNEKRWERMLKIDEAAGCMEAFKNMYGIRAQVGYSLTRDVIVVLINFPGDYSMMHGVKYSSEDGKGKSLYVTGAPFYGIAEGCEMDVIGERIIVVSGIFPRKIITFFDVSSGEKLGTTKLDLLKRIPRADEDWGLAEFSVTDTAVMVSFDTFNRFDRQRRAYLIKYW